MTFPTSPFVSPTHTHTHTHSLSLSLSLLCSSLSSCFPSPTQSSPVGPHVEHTASRDRVALAHEFVWLGYVSFVKKSHSRACAQRSLCMGMCTLCKRRACVCNYRRDQVRETLCPSGPARGATRVVWKRVRPPPPEMALQSQRLIGLTVQKGGFSPGGWSLMGVVTVGA